MKNALCLFRKRMMDGLVRVWLVAAVVAFMGALPQSSAAQGAAAAPVRAAPVAAAPDAAPPSALSLPIGEYKLDAADHVRVIVFNETTLSGEFVVGDTGMLSFPLIGDVVARGRTPGDLAKTIEQKLADGYLISPRVSIDVLTYRPYYILGEVTKPGEYAYSTSLTVMNAVAQAQGFTFRANKKKVFIRKSGEQEEREYKVAPDLKVSPGDTIRISERYF